MKGTQALTLHNVSLSFLQDKQTVPILNEINMQVQQGEFIALIGPSGCGKSTILHVIGGLLTPELGSVHIAGDLTTGRKGLVGFMPQEHALFPWRTIERNVIIAQEIAGVPRKQALSTARKWLVKVGLSGYERAYPYMLSGGMKQRAAFLRALLSNKELLLLDEPFGALDALTRMDMQQWLLQMWEETNRTVILVTHSIEEALLLADRVYVLSPKPASIINEVQVPFERPRKASLISHPEFIRLRQYIYDLLNK